MMSFGWIECIIYVVSRRRCGNKAEFPEFNAFSTLKKHNYFKNRTIHKITKLRKSEML